MRDTPRVLRMPDGQDRSWVSTFSTILMSLLWDATTTPGGPSPMYKRSRPTNSKSSRSHMREMQVDRAVADGEPHANLPRQRAFTFQRICSAILLLRRGSAPTPVRVTRESELWNLDLSTTKKKSLPIPRHTCPHHLSIPPHGPHLSSRSGRLQVCMHRGGAGRTPRAEPIRKLGVEMQSDGNDRLTHDVRCALSAIRRSHIPRVRAD